MDARRQRKEAARGTLEDAVTTDATVDRARKAFGRSAWGEAYTLWAEADRDQALAPDDLSSWATATYLVGHDAEADDLWIRAHEECLDRGHLTQAARCAFWLGLGLVLRGETARGGAWIGRAHRVLESVADQTVEHGYLLVPLGLQAMGGGDFEAAYSRFGQAGGLADRYGDGDLLALARLGQGRALAKGGETSRGAPVSHASPVKASRALCLRSSRTAPSCTASRGRRRGCLCTCLGIGSRISTRSRRPQRR